MDSKLTPGSAPTRLASDLAAATTTREARAALDRHLMPTRRRQQHGADRGATLDPVIGIWRRTGATGQPIYERDHALDDDLFWADVDRIGPKTSRHRVIVLGESVARGAFLDPLFNCASALRGYLDALCGAQEIEVVDLARSGLQFPQLLHLVTAAAPLRPDAFVIFAGNNWAMDATEVDWAAVATTLEAGGSWSDLATHFAEAMRTQISSWLFALAEAARAQNVPILFALPAHNVLDFRWPSEWHDPSMSTAEHIETQNRLEVAERLLAADDFSGAYAIAASIADTDRCVSARALQICGLCALKLGRRGEALECFARMGDSRLFVPLSGLLSCRTTLESEIRSAAIAEGMTLVDLPALMLQVGNGKPPGREMFLDQYHLTAEGIRIAMAAVARRVLPLLGRPSVSEEQVAACQIPVDPKAEAQGHFVAALVNLDIGMDDVVAHHAALSVRHESGFALLLRSMMRMMLGQTPEHYYGAYERIAAAAKRFPALRYVLYRMPVVAAQHVPVESIRALAAAADHISPGTREECESLLHGGALHRGQRTSLVPYALRREKFSSWRRDEPAYVRSFARRTEFQLRCAECGDLSLEITARSGGHHADANASILVNGVRVHQWTLARHWTTSACRVEARHLRPGINTLAIEWPDPSRTRRDQVRMLVDLFRAGPVEGLGFETEGLPVYGEVFALDAIVPASADTAPAGLPSSDVPLTAVLSSV